MSPLNQTHQESIGSQTIDHLIPMSRFDKKVTNSNCDAYRCNNRATSQVTVNVGRLGEIELNLCNNCVPKFNENKERSVSDQDTNRSQPKTNEYDYQYRRQSYK